jgi:hypothetical protein
MKHIGEVRLFAVGECASSAELRTSWSQTVAELFFPAIRIVASAQKSRQRSPVGYARYKQSTVERYITNRQYTTRSSRTVHLLN